MRVSRSFISFSQKPCTADPLPVCPTKPHALNPQEIEQAGHLLLQKFPEGVAEYAPSGLKGIALFRIVPEVISILDYRKGFGHADLVTDIGNVEGRS